MIEIFHWLDISLAPIGHNEVSPGNYASYLMSYPEDAFPLSGPDYADEQFQSDMAERWVACEVWSRFADKSGPTFLGSIIRFFMK
jgi:hypothetical protein